MPLAAWLVIVYEGDNEVTLEVLAATRLDAIAKARELHPSGTVAKALRSRDQSAARRP